MIEFFGFLLLLISVSALVMAVYYFVLIHYWLFKTMRSSRGANQINNKELSIYKIIFYREGSSETIQCRNALCKAGFKFIFFVIVALITGYFFEQI